MYLYSDRINIAALAEPQQQSPNTIQLVAMIIGPPIALLVLGFGIRWIIVGFQKPKPKIKSYY
jgi:hypothetical protein